MQHLDLLISGWFHQRLNVPFASLLYVLSGPGSGVFVGVVLAGLVGLFSVKRRWADLVNLILTVPGGMLLGEVLKLLVRRQRPYVTGPFVNWSGYSFPSGHTIGATLLYGTLVLLLARLVTRRRWQLTGAALGALIVLLVAFSRVALGAHYLSDVLAAMALGMLWLAACNLGFNGILKALVRDSHGTVPAEECRTHGRDGHATPALPVV